MHLTDNDQAEEGNGHQNNKNKKTSEDVATRREKNRIQTAKRRAAQTAEQLEQQRAKNRERMAKKRSSMTEEEKQANREKQRLRQQLVRVNMSEEQLETRRENDRARLAAMRANESNDQLNYRREREQHRQQINRECQTNEEINARRLVKRQRLQEARANMTQDQIENYRRSINMMRVNETEFETQLRRSNQTNRQATSRASRLNNLLAALSSIEDFDPTVTAYTVGSMIHECQFCGALKFQKELPNDCCLQGRIQLAPSAPRPQELVRLWSNPQFMEKIRAYNSIFSFTSMGASCDEDIAVDSRYANGRHGVYTFRVQGSICHRMSGLLPNEGKRPQFAQMYVYDPSMEQQVAARLNIMDGLDRDIVETIQRCLHEHNPFVAQFVTAGEYAREGRDCRLVIHDNQNTDLRTHNRPTANEVAGIIVDGSSISGRNAEMLDIIVHTRSGGFQRISELNPAYDPLHFPLLHVFGEPGWSTRVQYVDGAQRYNNVRVGTREYYAYKLFTRSNDESLLHRSGRLFQQWCVEQYVKIELQRLRYIKQNQEKFRSELYHGLADAIARDANLHRIGKFTLLPPTFTGGDRYMRKQYYDSMAIVREFGKPDLFLTMTCNPKWPEIEKALLDGQRPDDRPDIVARVFNLKFKALCEDITKGNVFGKVVAKIHVIEFQKRGLPHAHMLIKLAAKYRPTTPAKYDEFVCSEIPDPNLYPKLYDVVTTSMVHGPCGVLKPDAPCMKDGRCSKRFPKPFVSSTRHDPKGYPKYRRRDNGRTTIRHNVELDNQWIVPYNPYLAQKYACHINVEICSAISSVKYLYKYVYKGHDKAKVSLQRQPVDLEGREMNNPCMIEMDEIKQYLSARYISASESCWRLLSYDLQEKSHSVTQLPVHMPEQNVVTFRPDGQTAESLVVLKKTMLTEFFVKCSEDPNAHGLLYHEFPKHYTWDAKARAWKPRKRGGDKAIGRMVSVSLKDSERYFLRLLLCYVRGPTSFESLRTVDQVVHPSFQAAAAAKSLLANDTEWFRCMEEASLFKMPSQLRQLFSMILTCCSPADPKQLWDRFLHHMSEDYQRQLKYLIACGATILEFPSLPQYIDFEDVWSESNDELNRLIAVETSYDQAILLELASRRTQLNEDQARVFTTIIEAVNDPEAVRRVFFVDGPGGTGKSFTLNTILATIRSENQIAIAVATSGIAALQLMGGRTGHSTFKLGLNLTAESTCFISAQSDRAKLLQKASVIIWDEAPMMSKYGFEALDKTLKDIMKNSQVFGGKVVVLAGDFRQMLPVISGGTAAEIIDRCIQRSYIWQHCTLLRLELNMRTLIGQNSENATIAEFNSFLRRVGENEGSECQQCGRGHVKIPKGMTIPWSENGNALENLISQVFPNINERFMENDYFSNKVILTPLNIDVHAINDAIVTQLPGEEHEYKSMDSIEEQEGLDDSLYPVEYLNEITISGMPPHKLKLKIGTPVILLRNINGDEGLCNGTRLIIVQLRQNCLLASILTGTQKGRKVLIPRIPLVSNEEELPFKLRRRQFPIQLSFAMTINKSQGQTVEQLGVYLPQPVFAHGQLYVALSRSKSRDKIKILVARHVHQDSTHICLENVVYPGLTI